MKPGSNAIKFTKQGGLKIGVELAGDELIYRVVDTGIWYSAGRARERLRGVRQVDATVTREFGGRVSDSALREVWEMHGGRIWVESEIGKGCTFFFAVPLRTKDEGV